MQIFSYIWDLGKFSSGNSNGNEKRDIKKVHTSHYVRWEALPVHSPTASPCSWQVEFSFHFFSPWPVSIYSSFTFPNKLGFDKEHFGQNLSERLAWQTNRIWEHWSRRHKLETTYDGYWYDMKTSKAAWLNHVICTQKRWS